ncbi:hypothetical protein CFB52_004865 [Burkholderia sp. AU18528]|uniref:hypothetical protein n=1 Tax=Burkholderia sp. AU18528 TaxID=2015350 RepID=UPI000C077C0A|nr:hypothetical protein [Burkholderia sp. AU18528]PHP89545.1 hypothetical protein CFB52_004865 [Burkholderia sp. AU18528]
MKHGNGIRFAFPRSASRRAGRPRARGATARRVVARMRAPSWLAVPFAAAPVARATAARCAGNHALAASAATFARAIAAGRGARSMPPLAQHRAAPVRRRPFSSVRLTLMQDPSS